MTKKLKVAIIGSGSSGANAAYVLHSELGENVEITVFEKNAYSGGRAHAVRFQNQLIEIGGSIVHSSNENTVELMNFTNTAEMQSALNLDGKDEVLGFFDGKKIYLKLKNSVISMAICLIKRFGPLSTWLFRKYALKTVNNWKKIYNLQRAGKVFENTGETISTLELTETFNSTLADFYKTHHISQKIANEFCGAILQNMYNQDARANAMAGQVGLAGAGLAGGHLFAIAGSNGELFQKVFDKIGANIHFNTKITEILPNNEGVEVKSVEVSSPEFDPQSNPANSKAKVKVETFDKIIIAAPLELANLKIETDLAPSNRQFQKVEVTLVVGNLRNEYFNEDANEILPSSLFIQPNQGLPYKSIGITGVTDDGRRIYKIFSKQQIELQLINQIFGDIKDVKTDILRFTWQGAYPVLTPRGLNLPFKLAENVYYSNGFESAASAIETNAVAARNTAKLLIKEL